MRCLRLLLLLPLLLFLLAGCGEGVQSTRLPVGAVGNFFYHLQYGTLEDAMAYWAPDYTPADARTRTQAAISRLANYEVEAGKGETTRNADGSLDVTLRGRVRPQAGSVWQEDSELLRARLIQRGPGWRLTDFTLVCCP